jgi:ferric-dicitrate binding protein FerR (iron transport regulator)
VTEPDVKQLLAPLTEPEVEGAGRRIQVDRDKIIARMVEVSLAPEERFSSRARWGAVVALAAGFALAAWGGMQWLGSQGEQAALAGVEVQVLRGQVTPLNAEGVLETSSGAEARIKARGLELDLLENTKVSLKELGASATSAAVRLDRGRVRCVIPHRPGREFAVVTADARVVDIGTIFSVTVQPSPSGNKTLVHVEEGEVIVHHAGGQSRVTASQSWTSRTPEPPPAAPPPASADDLPVEETPSRPAPPRRPRETLETETQLLRNALASEQKGDLPAARKALESLVLRYPESPLAPDAKAALSRVKRRLESAK